MKFSIVIPTLTEATTIGDMLSQFHKPRLKSQFDYEVIVSDGGSTDNTVAVATAQADKVLVWDRHKGRQKIGIGRNTGGFAATGDVIIFLDSDVRIPDMARFLTTATDTFKRADVVAATCAVLIYPSEERWYDAVFHRGLSWFMWLLVTVGYGTARGECQMVRRSIFNELDGYSKTLPASEDFDLFHRLSKRGRVVYLRQTRVYESPRRYRKYGYLKLIYLWVSDWISTVVLRRTQSKEWEEIR